MKKSKKKVIKEESNNDFKEINTYDILIDTNDGYYFGWDELLNEFKE
jgi:hypothetical protein